MLFVGLSKNGRGVFTQADILESSLIESCPTLLLPKIPNRPYSDLECQLRRYAFAWSEDLDAIALGLGSIYNHSPEANLRVSADKVDATIKFYAKRFINAGEELTSNYGFDPRFQAFTKEVENRIDTLRRRAKMLEVRFFETIEKMNEITYEDLFKDAMD